MKKDYFYRTLKTNRIYALSFINIYYLFIILYMSCNGLERLQFATLINYPPKFLDLMTTAVHVTGPVGQQCWAALDPGLRMTGMP